jgi:hypothetical protein
VSLSAAQGQVTVLLGRNGVGKTTLLKSLMGLVPIKSGSVDLDGRDLTSAKPYERASAGIGYVPQGREIFARLTVEDNLRMGLATRPGGTPIPPELFELFPVLKQMLHRRGGDLSGGQQQQLAIARALAARPRPTGWKPMARWPRSGRGKPVAAIPATSPPMPTGAGWWWRITAPATSPACRSAPMRRWGCPPRSVPMPAPASIP